MSAGTWEAEVDPDDPSEIALTNPSGQYAYGFPLKDAKGIRDALNELPDVAFEEE